MTITRIVFSPSLKLSSKFLFLSSHWYVEWGLKKSTPFSFYEGKPGSLRKGFVCVVTANACGFARTSGADR